MHACICTASHGFLVLPCQKLPYIPEIKIVRKVKRYLHVPTCIDGKAFNWLSEAKKGRGIQPPSHHGMILHSSKQASRRSLISIRRPRHRRTNQQLPSRSVTNLMHKRDTNT